MIKRIFILLICLFSFAGWAHSALNLSANPVTGGSGIRFGRVDNALEVNREVRLRITSTNGVQYQVYQRLVEPINNERGDTIGHDAIKTYTLLGSNGSGSLYAQSPENLGLGDQLIYSSAPDGSSDSFVVVYSTVAQNIRGSGNFFGKLVYTIRSIGSGQSDSAVMDISLEAPSQFTVDINGSVDRDSVRVNTTQGQLPYYVDISFSGNTDTIRIYQEVDTFLQNDLLEPLALGVLTFRGSGSAVLSGAPQPITNRRQLVYESTLAEDKFQVVYDILPEKLLNVSAGKYRGRLRYVVESGSNRQEFPIDVEATIDPIFKMTVELPQGGVKFNNLLPDSPPQLNEVEVKIESNLGRPYMVVQQVADNLTNAKGDKIDSKYFTIKEELTSGDGKISHSDFSPITVGDLPIFYSDSTGSSATFKVYYRLTPFAAIEPGDYSTAIQFSLSEF